MDARTLARARCSSIIRVFDTSFEYLRLRISAALLSRRSSVLPFGVVPCAEMGAALCATQDARKQARAIRLARRAARREARHARRASRREARRVKREALLAARGAARAPSEQARAVARERRAARRSCAGRPPARAAGARRWRWRLHPDAPRHFANSASQPGRGRFGRRRRDAAAAGAAAGGEAEDEASGGEDDAEGPGRALSIVSGASPARPPSGTLTRR